MEKMAAKTSSVTCLDDEEYGSGVSSATGCTGVQTGVGAGC